MLTRLFKRAIGLLAILGCFATQGVAWADASPRMARGLIVKLKDGSLTSVVKRTGCDFLKEAADLRAFKPIPSGRLKALGNVARRHRLVNADFKPTACGAHVIRGGRYTTVQEAQARAAEMSKDPDVEWVIVNEVLKPMSVSAPPSVMANPNLASDPDDLFYQDQKWLHTRANEPGLSGIGNIAAAWSWMSSWTLPLTPPVVAVLDSGVVYTPEFDGRLVLPGYDFVTNSQYSADGDGRDADPTDPGYDPNHPDCNQKDQAWHGMNVLSMLASRTGNGGDPNGGFGAGILAPVPDGSGGGVLPIRVGGICGADTNDIIEGMLWAAGVNYAGSPALNQHPARIINISYGGALPCDVNDDSSKTRTPAWLYRQTIDTLRALNNGHGVLVVASAGNGDVNTGVGLSGPSMPANCPYVLAVTALNMRGYKASYANFVDGTSAQSKHLYAVAVAGGDANPPAGYRDDGIVTLGYSNLGVSGVAPTFQMLAVQGTSFSSPTVAGIAALMLAVNPNLSTQNLLDLLTTTATDFSGLDTSLWPAVNRCDPVSERGNCQCTQQTCGSGVVDALSAVDAARRATTTPFVQGDTVYVNYYSAVQAQQAGAPDNKQSGGGGGAMDAGSLLALLSALMAVVVIRIKGGRP